MNSTAALLLEIQAGAEPVSIAAHKLLDVTFDNNQGTSSDSESESQAHGSVSATTLINIGLVHIL